MVSRLLLRILHFGLLLVGVMVALTLPGRTVSPGLFFVLLAVYAHAAARVLGVRGIGKAAVFLEVLPFYGFAIAFFGRLDLVPALQILAGGSAWAAAILTAECWFVMGSPTFGSSLGFIAACVLAGFGLAVASPVLMLGLGLLIWSAAGYGLARRRA
jgi:hypothetical protein